MFQIGLVSPDLILKYLISLVVSLAQLESPSVALLAELVLAYFLHFRHYDIYQGTLGTQEQNPRGSKTIFSPSMNCTGFLNKLYRVL